jgi:hypothetical protein
LIFDYQTRKIPTNSAVAKQREEFKTYQPRTELQSWQNLATVDANDIKLPELAEVGS